MKKMRFLQSAEQEESCIKQSMFTNPGFWAVLILAGIHFFANQLKMFGWIWHGRFLSFAAGISFAYVFVDLLPALEKGQLVLQKTFEEIIPYFDRHAYLIALFGVLFYYGLHAYSQKDVKRNFWLEMSGYLLFNFFVGASLADSRNPDIQPLFLFTLALAMHYFVHDHNLEEDNQTLYQTQARRLLVISLFLGYFVGYLIGIPNAVEAIVVSFLAGGVLLNSLRYELPKREQVAYASFVLGALLYSAILLRIGA